MGEHAPWWVALAVSAGAGLAAAVGKVWADQRAEIRQLREDLKAANERASELPTEHVRDLRRIAGLSTSLEPPPAGPRPRPPPVKRPRR